MVLLANRQRLVVVRRHLNEKRKDPEEEEDGSYLSPPLVRLVNS
jgi:hypothetical protein